MDGWMAYRKTVADAMLATRKRIFGRIYTCEGPLIYTWGYSQGPNRVMVH